MFSIIQPRDPRVPLDVKRVELVATSKRSGAPEDWQIVLEVENGVVFDVQRVGSGLNQIVINLAARKTKSE